MVGSWRSKWLAAPLALAVACAAPEEGNEELELGSTQQELIRDQTSGGAAGFFWAFPIGPLLSRSNGTFEPRLSPQVRIDQVDAQGNTIRNVATYTGSVATFGERILRNLNQKFYVVRFKSASANLNPALNYRVRVLPAAGQPELGFADLDVVNNLLESLRVDRSKFQPLIKGATLAIRFRIDKNAVDKDGDGVFDWLDNCPGVKNPPQSVPADVPAVSSRAPSGCDAETTSCDPQDQALNPLTTLKQPDSDNDGVGDACDCPAGSTGTPPSCTPLLQDATISCRCLDGRKLSLCGTDCSNPTQFAACAVACGVSDGTTAAFGCDTVPDFPQCNNAAPCPTGYEPGTFAQVCRDIDECKLDIDGCSAQERCVNLEGTSTCIACPEGSQNDGNDFCTPF